MPDSLLCPYTRQAHGMTIIFVQYGKDLLFRWSFNAVTYCMVVFANTGAQEKASNELHLQVLFAHQSLMDISHSLAS